MITLITGTPGAGKTLYTVAELSKDKSGRQLIVDGIPELVIPHELPPESGIEAWPDWVPDGALIVIDEAQRIFRPRANGAKVPPHVAMLETHRHKGLDFILITQHPNLIDQNVRRLVGRHIHLRATALGRWLYEWSECGEPDSRNSRAVSEQRRYTLPKSAFGLYKSASLHVKPKYRIPKAAFIFVGCVALASVLGFRIYGSMQKRLHPETAQAEQAAAAESGGAAPPRTGSLTTQSAPAKPPAGAVVTDYYPRVANRPETAPMFDGLRNVQSMEWPAACLASASKCNCYTDQATLIRSMDEVTCRDIVENGRFNPYQPPRYAAQTSVPPPVMVSPPTKSG